MPEPFRELTPGDLFAGKYRIDVEVARGGMGIVYRASQDPPGRTVAVKVIHPASAGDRDYRQRFQQEAKLASQIEHANVIPIYDVGDEDGLLYIVMRFVAGVDLGGLLADRGPLDPAHAAQIVAQVASALDAAHSRGLVHRDVKPANVLVANGAGGEHIYLTDFGLTKRVTDVGLHRPTKPGHWVGTLDYIAPEQLSGEAADGRADVYSLGCVLYELVTGVVPFPFERDEQKMYGHLDKDPPAPSTVERTVPVELDAVIARAMAKRPDVRYPTAGELARAVSSALLAAELARPSSPESRPTGAIARNSVAFVIGLAALLFGVLGYVASGLGDRAVSSDGGAQTAARVASLARSSTFARQLDGVLVPLEDVRLRERLLLSAARTPEQESRTAERLVEAYSRAAASARIISPSPEAAAINKRIVDAIGAAEMGYAALAEAAARHQPARYAAARAQITSSDARLDSALTGLRSLGYHVT